jgi:hypothetical protein
MATKIVEVLDVSLGYLVESTDVVLEKSLVRKINEIQKLPEEDKVCGSK